MASCMGEIFIFSLKDQFNIPDDVIGCHCYHDKSQSELLYNDEKKAFTEAQDMIWSPKNKRPEKLKDGLKEVEELLSQHKVVHIRWRSRKVLQIALSNMAIVTFVFSCFSGDAEKVFIDKSLVGKGIGETVSDAFVSDQFFITTYPDKPKVDYGFFIKRPPIGEAIKRLEKISAWEPKTVQMDIPGPLGRRLERRVSVNTRQDMVLVWWPTSSIEAWPWSPMSTDRDRANLIVLSIHGPNIDLLAYNRTECDPFHASFSCLQPHRFFTIEQSQSGGGETTAHTSTYEIIQGKIQRISNIAIPLKSHVTCLSRNHLEDKLVLGCADGSIVLYDEGRKSTFYVRAALIPACISWHPTGTVFFVVGFDMALSPLKVQLVSEDPCTHRILPVGKFFKVPYTLKDIKWCLYDPKSVEWNGDYTDAMYMHFDRGPPVVFILHLGVISRERLSGLELVKEYLKHRQEEEAVQLLKAMNWDMEGPVCYSSQLESTLGTFYAPKRPLSEVTIMDYRDPISRLARRFFHQLLRYSRFDKAFLLAVDIGSRDLFMDIHYMALDKGETALAEVAKRKAEQIESESLDSFDDYDDDFVDNGFHQLNQQHLSQNEGHLSNGDLRNGGVHNGFHSHHSYGNRGGYLANGENRNSHVNSVLSDIEADLISDYTTALQLEPQWTNHDRSTPDRNNSSEEEDKPKSVKVIHFGIV
ncbi:CPLANE5 [Mytilus edulis]|uniref:WDPCP n=1 Tax=Mytilus edulis TaxID=6550 RepID=A0A8S3TPM3_MYTED|nr:CPLANE5 [Mytilus edulis]